MRITTKSVFDIESGELITWEGYEYEGPVAQAGRKEAKDTNTQAKVTSGTGLSQANQTFGMSMDALNNYNGELGKFMNGPDPYAAYRGNTAFSDYKSANPYGDISSKARDLYSTYAKGSPYATFMDTDPYSSASHKMGNQVLADSIAAGGKNSTADQLSDYAKRTGATSSQFANTAAEIGRQNQRDLTAYRYGQENTDLDKTNANRQFATSGLDAAQRYATGGQAEANLAAASGTEGHNLAAAKGLDAQALEATKGTDARQRFGVQGMTYSPDLLARMYGTAWGGATGALGPAASTAVGSKGFGQTFGDSFANTLGNTLGGGNFSVSKAL